MAGTTAHQTINEKLEEQCIISPFCLHRANIHTWKHENAQQTFLLIRMLRMARVY